MNNSMHEKKNFNAQGKSAIFLSNVPNCKDLKVATKGAGAVGPGADEKSTADHSMLSGTNDHRRSTADSGALNQGGNKGNQNFLSTTKREDHWINRIDAPYTHPTNFQNPGPGKYNHEKKKDDIKAKILLEETVHIPFGASEERACNKPHPKSNVPGPGTYIDPSNPHNSSVA